MKSILLLTSCWALAAAPNRAPLQANAFQPLPLTSVMPKGWLLDQLRLQAQGLSGHLDEFWPDLGPTSAWLGGSGEGWERGPYFLDGLVPLAYLTGDATLIAKVRKWRLVPGGMEVTERRVGNQPFNAASAPVEITAKARRLPEWTLVDDSPGPLPVSPVTSKRPEETVTLVPYGAAKLRITAFPYLLP